MLDYCWREAWLVGKCARHRRGRVTAFDFGVPYDRPVVDAAYEGRLPSEPPGESSSFARSYGPSSLRTA